MSRANRQIRSSKGIGGRSVSELKRCGLIALFSLHVLKRMWAVFQKPSEERSCSLSSSATIWRASNVSTPSIFCEQSAAIIHRKAARGLYADQSYFFAPKRRIPDLNTASPDSIYRCAAGANPESNRSARSQNRLIEGNIPRRAPCAQNRGVLPKS